MASKGFRESFRSSTGLVCDKWEQYIGIYDAEMRAILARGEPVRLLEIGVQNGGSLELWSKALPAGSEVVGIDIDPGCASLALPANARVLVGDATDEAFLQSALGEQTFDLVIDDGSHRSRDIALSFRLLFPRLRGGGRYFIEDLHASYWRAFGGAFRAPDSAIEFLKSLIDALHTDHIEEAAAIDPAERATLAALNKDIARVTFIDSLAVVEKYAQPKTRPFARTLAGSRIDSATAEWRTFLRDWSSPVVILDDAVRKALDADRLAAITDLRARLGASVAAVEELRAQNAAAAQALAEGAAARRALERAHKEQTGALTAAHAEVAEAAAARQALQQSHETLRRDHAALQQSHDTLRGSHDALSRSHHQLGQSHDELRARLKAIKRSWSWRLAYPARWLERLVRRPRKR